MQYRAWFDQFIAVCHKCKRFIPEDDFKEELTYDGPSGPEGVWMCLECFSSLMGRWHRQNEELLRDRR